MHEAIRFIANYFTYWTAFFLFAQTQTELPPVPYTSDLIGIGCAMIACLARCYEMVVNRGMTWPQLSAEVFLAALAGAMAHALAVEILKIASPRLVWFMCAAAGFLGSIFLNYAISRAWPEVKTP
jgi:hypothetical protein